MKSFRWVVVAVVALAAGSCTSVRGDGPATQPPSGPTAAGADPRAEPADAAAPTPTPEPVSTVDPDHSVDPRVRPAAEPGAVTGTGAPTEAATAGTPDTLIPTATVTRPTGQAGSDGVVVPLSTDSVDSTVDRRPLGVRLTALLDRAPFDGMFWGLVVREAGSGRVLYERNSARKFVPASAMKMLTAAAALRDLGTDYRYRTEVYSSGRVRNGTLEGSLFIAASGDPTWSGRFRSGWRQPMEALADQILAAGIRRVSERVVVDASRWDSTSVVGTWQAEDLPWGWAASGGAMVAADGALRLRVTGSRTRGRAAGVVIDPELPDARFDGQVMTTATDSVRLRAFYRPRDGQIVLRGEVPRGRRYATSLAMRDPVRITTELMLEVFRDKGIEVAHGAGFAWDLGADLGRGCAAGRLAGCAGMERVATLESPPLSVIVKAMLEPSQNWIAEQILRTLALEAMGRAEWGDGLERATRVLVDDFGIAEADLDLHDGSGLSSYTLVTPRAVARVLAGMRDSDLAAAYYDALPAPGELDSTLERRLGGLEGRLSAKTGTLHHVNSLAGYLTRDDGEELIFVIMSNSSGLDTDDVRAVVDQAVREMARSPRP